MTAVPAGRAAQRAVVFGGGGSAGNAWLIGVAAGLSDAGVDLTAAELVVGTSAGATTAVQLASARPADLYAAILAAAPPPAAAGRGATAGHMTTEAVAEQLRRTGAIIAAAQDPADMRRRMGAAALELAAAAGEAASARWRAVVGARLPPLRWPEQLLVAAVDARTGEPVVFDRHSGIDLVDAVAASTSSGAAYPIGDARYIDGGYRRNENADLAAGCGRVLVLSPLGGRTRHPLAWGMQLAAQVDELRAAGSRVETMLPDDEARAAFGPSLMDPSTRPAAARAGFAYGRARADALTDFWRG